jgi:hypothetical protein
MEEQEGGRLVIMSETVGQRNLNPSDTKKSQPIGDSPSSASACSQNPEDRGTGIKINDGVLAGLHGLRLQDHGSDRCLVQLEIPGPHLLVEIDKVLVERAS